MDLGLRGKRALITGSSRGIGKAIARVLGQEGVDCVISGRNLERAAATARELRRETGGNMVALAADVATAAGCAQLAQDSLRALGGIDILINSGARVSGGQPEDLAHVSDELILTDFEEKVLGALRLVRALVPGMRQAGWGRILNISGGAGRFATGISAGARNSAVVNLTKNLANELGRDGINVNAIHPGTTITETFEERMQRQAQQQGLPVHEHIQRMRQAPAIGRLVTAEELAPVAAFLVSPLAVGVTGEVIAVTGGTGNAVFY